MSLSRQALALFALAASATAFACAAPTESAGDGEAATDDAAVTSAKKTCTPQAYEQAFARYKLAVDHAKVHLRGGVCDEGATEFEIANDLGAAVASCGKFQEIIKTSPWAAPARDVLKANVALPLLDGTISIKDKDGKTAFAGLAAGLAGKTMYGPAPGVYGNISKLEFAEGGAATYHRMGWDDERGMPNWSSSPARYAIGAPKADGSIEITVTIGQTSTVYDLRPETSPAPYQHTPELIMKPRAADGEELRSMPSECEA